MQRSYHNNINNMKDQTSNASPKFTSPEEMYINESYLNEAHEKDNHEFHGKIPECQRRHKEKAQ